MADIAAGNVTYSITKRSPNLDGMKMSIVRASFGDGALTLPAGGIPLTIAKMGFANSIYGFCVLGSSIAGKSFIPDSINAKLKVYEDAGAAGDMAEDTSAPAASTVDLLVFGY